MSAYLLGNLIFIIVWLILFTFKPKNRKLQLFGSLLLLPFAVLDIWFRQKYWHPPLLIKVIEPFSLETALYCFTAGGIAIVFGFLLFKNNNNFQLIWSKIIIFLVVAFGLYAIFQGFSISSAMNNLNFSFLVIWLAFLVTNFNRNVKSIVSAVIFAIFTIISINIGLKFYPNFTSEYWNLDKLWPTFLNTPTEEIFFAGVLGALWALLPKYLLGFKKP